MIREMHQDDAGAVLEIYRLGLATGEASFETEVPDWPAWKRKHHPFCRLVFARGGRVLGWAALAPVSTRACYRGVAEVSIYVDTRHHGEGIGNALLAALIGAAEAHGIWTLNSSIFPENTATLKLHRRHGFREVGVRERIARHHGRWRDTLLLERRSQRVGVDPDAGKDPTS